MTVLEATPTTGRPASTRPPGARPRRSPLRERFPGLALPALIWYAVFMIGPVVAIFVIAFLRWPGMLETPSFAGVDNFRVVFADATFWAALGNSAVQIVVGLPIMIVLAFLLAFYVVQKPRGHRVLRYILFIPALISAPATAMVFYAMLNPDGLVNGLLAPLGLAGNAWLADPSTALGAIIAVELWSGIGYSAVLIAARLDGVDTEIVQAARVDGASDWRIAWRMYWPIARDFIGVVTMLQFLSLLFNSAQTVLLLTQGGPGTSTMTLSYLIYSKAFVETDLGYSQAVGVVLFVLGLLGMWLIRRTLRATH
ncbi:carbohydrate ABC transporter permease [Plantibacter cousiniae (nom. nud.)]|uniref:Carbohydrate ABC transporter membrane protein 1, CUT1 family n=1 Tax=Plantibacter cousiniae (nom. nud.) TaxID=199709 RepID=A0ABY1LPP7_9MICO|nr:sugar ABC transporter permease [Plantibacter cousiniae]SKC70860.1 carbohydrate ABC transporter membrane protein 1, CUT1 family [Plantibacter cousiniae]